jgi:hypothetical protein
MNAIKAVRKYLADSPKSESSLALARLVVSLAEEHPYSLAELYRMNYRAFVLAMDLLHEWGGDRRHLARLRLFDVVVNEVGMTNVSRGSTSTQTGQTAR